MGSVVASPYKVLNLHQHHLNHYIDLSEMTCTKMEFIKEKLQPLSNQCSQEVENIHTILLDLSTEFYEYGLSGLDILQFIETSGWWCEKDVIFYSVSFYNIKSEYRCEKLLMFYLLDMMYVLK
jgi:hypothetical protein